MLRAILFIFLFFQMNVYAASATETLTQLLGRVQTLQADFTQVIIDKSGRSLQKSQGKMQLQRPGKFRWNVTRPNAQLIVANGSRLWVYDPDLEQVTIRSLKKEAGEAPALLLSNTDESLARDFQVEKIPPSPPFSKGGRGDFFVLTPRDKSSMLSVIKLGFANNQIQQMQLQDHLGHTTIIHFYHVVINSPLSASLFTFKPPASVDVIDETR